MNAPLEARCRRLILAYPRSHRAVHGAEMLGVLLACTGPGRERPQLRDCLDVVRGGLLIRLRRVGAAGWADAAAVTGLVALLLMCALAPMGLMFGPLRPSALAAGHHPVMLMIGALPLLAWPMILLLAYAGYRISAAVVGLAALALGHEAVRDGFAVPTFGLEGAWRLLAIVALLGAITGGGPRAAARVLGRSRTIAVVTGCAVLGLAHLLSYLAPWPRLPRTDLPILGAEAWTAVGIAAGLGLLLVGVLRPGRVGRATGVLLACPLAFYVVEILSEASTLSLALRVELWDHGALVGFLLAAAMAAAALPLSAARRSPH